MVNIARRRDKIQEKLAIEDVIVPGPDITSLVANCFPGEVCEVRDGIASWASRDWEWPVELENGCYLANVVVHNRRLETHARPISGVFETRDTGFTYEVWGDEEAPVASLTQGNDPSDCLPGVKEGFRPLIDSNETAKVQKEVFEYNLNKILELCELAPERRWGSSQSGLLSFEYLNFTTSASLSPEGLSISSKLFNDNPEPFYA